MGSVPLSLYIKYIFCCFYKIVGAFIASTKDLIFRPNLYLYAFSSFSFKILISKEITFFKKKYIQINFNLRCL